MQLKHCAFLFLIIFDQHSFTQHHNDYSQFTSGTLSQSNDLSLRDTSNFKVIEYKNITLSTNLWITAWHVACWAISYIHTSKHQKQINRDRKELDQKYKYYSPDHYIQALSGHTALFNPNYSYDFYTPYPLEDQNSINPLFEKYELYRFPNFQMALYQDINFERSILQVEQKLRYLTKSQLNPPGYRQGELEAIVKGMADDIRRKQKEFEKKVAFAEKQSQKQQAWENQKKERELEEAAQKKLTQQTIQKNQIKQVLQNQNNELNIYCHTLQALDEPLACYTSKRLIALQEHVDGKDKWTEKPYPLSSEVTSLLNEHAIDTKKYTVFFGNQMQHALHQEFVAIIGDTSIIHHQLSKMPDDCKTISSTLTRFADAGQLHNKAGYIKKACSFADFCWGIIDSVQQAYAFECELENAIGRGFMKGGKNFAHKALDPIKTLNDMQNGIRHLAQLVLEFTEDIKLKAYLSVKRVVVQRAHDMRDLAYGTATLHGIAERDSNQLCYSVGQSVVHVHGALQVVWGKIDRENVLYAAEEGTAFATEIALSHATLSALGSLASSGGTALKNVIDAGGGAGNFLDLPFTSGTLEASIAYESIFVDAAELVQVAGVEVAHVLDKASQVAPPLLMAANNAHGGSGPTNPVSGINSIPNPPIAYYPMADDLPEIRLMFHETRKGFGPMANQYIKIDLEHILEGEVITKTKGSRIIKKLHGCHHDLLGYLEENSIITLEDKIFGPFGTYKAKPMGHKLYKSFFPHHWLRKTVITNIFEAYDNFLLSKTEAILQLDGKWLLRGKSNIGLEIEMFINGSGKICTAYPVF